jgi:branched-chain amino acid aminotransferase
MRPVEAPTLTIEPEGAEAKHPNPWVYVNGQFLRYHDVRIGLVAHALHHGTACFEGIRAYWNAERGQLYLLQPAPHYERLRQSARVLHMSMERSTEDLVGVTLELLRRNQLREDAYVRPILFKSGELITPAMDDIEETFAIYVTPFGRHVEAKNGIRCMVSSWRRIPDQAVPPRAKLTGAYVNACLIKSEAVHNGFDDAISLTMDGHVSEASVANLFMLRNGVFATPAITDDILEGVTRRLLMGLIEDELGLQTVERSIDRSELYGCEELLLCGTGAELQPVVELDRRPVGDGHVGPLSRRLRQSYMAAVRGESSRYTSWTIPVWPDS